MDAEGAGDEYTLVDTGEAEPDTVVYVTSQLLGYSVMVMSWEATRVESHAVQIPMATPWRTIAPKVSSCTRYAIMPSESVEYSSYSAALS